MNCSLLRSFSFQINALAHKASGFFCLVLCLLISTQGYNQSQQYRTDSLQQQLLVTDNDSLKIQLYVQLADNYKNLDPTKMEAPLDSALILSQELNWLLAIGIVYNYKGIYHCKKGEYQQSLQYYLAALDIMGQLQNSHGIADNLVSVGNLYSDLKNYEKAREYMLKAMDFKKFTGTDENLLTIYNNLGTISHDLKDFDNALGYYNKALTIAKADNDQNSAITQFINIANTYINLGYYDQCLKYLFVAKEFCEDLENKEAMPHVLITLGQVYKLKKQYTKAINYLEEGLYKASAIGARELIQQTYLQLSDVYKQMGNYDEAYKAYKKYTSVKDSLQGNLMQMIDVQATYQLGKNEQVVAVKELELVQTVFQKRKMVYIGIVVTLLLTIFGGFVFLRKRKLGVVKKQIELENSILGQANLDLKERLQKLSDEVSINTDKSAKQVNRKKKKYSTSSLSTEEKGKYMGHILGYMETEKPYLDFELTLANFAAELTMPSYHLSEVLNESLGKNFYDFVNIYRVEEVKKKIADSKASTLTLLALAYDSGFNSKTAFNRAFKKATGLSPSLYKQQYLENQIQ